MQALGYACVYGRWKPSPESGARLLKAAKRPADIVYVRLTYATKLNKMCALGYACVMLVNQRPAGKAAYLTGTKKPP